MFRIHAFRPPDRSPLPSDVAWLLASAAGVVLLLSGQVPGWLAGFCLCLLAWRWLGLRSGWPQPPRWLRLVLAATSTALVFANFGTVFGRDAGTALLLILIGFKVLESRTLRDYLIVAFLLYFLILARFFFSQSLVIGLGAGVLAALVTISMIRLSQGPAIDGWHVLRLGGGLLLRAAPVMLVLYLLFPRIQGSLWALPADAHESTTGLSDELAPGSVHALLLDDSIVFRAEFEGGPPGVTTLYWRTLVMSHTDGRRWSVSPLDRARREVPVSRTDSPAVRYTVFHEPSEQAWLPTLDLPVAVDPALRLDRSHTAQAPRPLRTPLSFRAESDPDARDIRTDPAALRFMQRWPGAVSPRVAELVDDLHRVSADPENLVVSLLTYFNQQPFHYTLEPPALGPDPLDSFLFDTRRGYCEYYAFAFAALMRIAGIPSRIVTGYQGGEWNASANHLIVRRSDAHAWVEVWLGPRGWRRVDPTAAVAPERIELGVDALRRMQADGIPFGSLDAAAIRDLIARGWLARQWLRARYGWDDLNLWWDKWVMAYGPDAQHSLLTRLGYRSPDWADMVTLMAAAVSLVLAVWVVLLRRRRPRSDPVAGCYQRFCRKLARVGLAPAVSEGPVTFASRVSRERPDLASAVTAITGLYVGLRYTGASPAGLPELRRRIARFRPRRWPGRPHRTRFAT